MRIVGYVLIAASFLICSFITVMNEREINWALFIPFLIMGIVGVVIARVSMRREATSEAVVTKNIGSLRQSLDNIVKNIKQLNQDKENINVYDLPPRIDQVFLHDLNTFVGARESIGFAYTLQDYADIMSHYAAGERYLNRVWSAAADGYQDESHTFIQKAQNQFEEANEKLNNLNKEKI